MEKLALRRRRSSAALTGERTNPEAAVFMNIAGECGSRSC